MFPGKCKALCCRFQIALLLLMLSVSGHTQNTAFIDSLEVVVSSAAHDTIKISAFIAMGRSSRNTDVHKARVSLSKADSLAVINNRPLDRMRIASGRGILEAMQGNYPEAFRWMENALQTAYGQNYPAGEAENLVNLGILNRRIGNYPASQEYYLKALAINDSLGDLAGISATFQNLGVVTDLMKDHQMAMEYYKKALEIEKSFENSSSMANIYNNMAIIEHQNLNYPLAIQLLKEALAINKRKEDWIGATANYLNLGNFHNKDGQPQVALLFLDSANILLAGSTSGFSRATLAFNYAETHLTLNNLPKALENARESLQVAEQLKGFRQLADAHFILSKTYEKMLDFPEALIHYKSFTSFQDSLFNETKNREIANYQVQLDVFSKNKKIEEQSATMQYMNQAMIKERRLLLLVGVIAALSLLVVYLLVQKFIQSRRTGQKLIKQNQLIQKQKEEIESVNRQLEMRLLRTQLNPHFIFNALSSIQHLITGNEKSSALNYMGKFSRLLRQVLDNSAETTVTLSEEIKLLKAYIELEALRFNHDFSYEISLSEDIDPESIELPVLLVQPLIENSIIHGLLPSKKEKKLMVFFKLENENLVCEIQDNGVGRQFAEKNKCQKQELQKSHGLNITRQRITSRQADMEHMETITYTDLVSPKGEIAGTRVIVQIPSTF
jgi:tetratricopeptide (TPR) repeat protein